MALTAGGVPTPADLESLTETFFAGQKLRPAQLDELAVFVDGDKLRSSDWPDVD
jgi:hypothetical protein